MQYPWAVEFITNKKILITERPGYLRIYENGKLSTPIKGLPSVKAERQGGLLDVVLDPDFNKNKIIFFSYSAGNMFGIGTEVASARLVNHELKDVKVLFRALPKSKGGLHFGSRLLLTGDNSLYITLGDRGEMDRAQDLSLIHI